MKGDHDGYIDLSWLKQTGDYAEWHPELFQVMVWTFSFLHFLRFSILHFRVLRCRVSTTKKCRKSLYPCINHSWNTDLLSCTIYQRPREQSRSLSKKSSAYPYNAPFTVRYWTFRPPRSLQWCLHVVSYRFKLSISFPPRFLMWKVRQIPLTSPTATPNSSLTSIWPTMSRRQVCSCFTV